MKRIFYKTRAVGPSTLSVPGIDLMFQLRHLVLYVVDPSLSLGGQLDCPVLVGQVSFVEFPKAFVEQITKLTDKRVPPKRLTDIIDHDACILSARIWNKQDSIDGNNFGRDVDEGSFWSLPNGVKLGFDENLLPLLDMPAYQLFSTVTGNMLWHDRETFVQWLVGQGLHGNMERLAAGNDLSTENFDVAVN